MIFFSCVLLTDFRFVYRYKFLRISLINLVIFFYFHAFHTTVFVNNSYFVQKELGVYIIAFHDRFIFKTFIKIVK